MKKLFVTCSALALVAAISTTASAQEGAPKAKAVPVAKPAQNANAPKAKHMTARKVGPLSVTVEIIGGTYLRGTLAEAIELPMRTSFGNADIPLSEVAGIRLASKDSAVTTVVLHNGDSITGATNLSNLMVETEWGRADISGSSISNILFAPGLKWSSSAGLNGNRWALADVPADPATEATQEKVSPAQLRGGRFQPTPQPTGARRFNRGF